ncbi:MAG: VIT1/CCC1 transporter family protein, partial [Pseudomonadota bacterium]
SNAVAKHEADACKAHLFRSLAEASEEQAAIWAHDLNSVPEFKPSMRSRVIAILLEILPARLMRNVLSAQKVRGMSLYRCSAQTIAAGSTEAAHGKQASNRSNDGGHPWPTSVEDIGKRHGSNVASGTLRAGVFGVNDGLVSNTCLVMGVAGAGVGSAEILLTGIAGLLAGAFSMGAGEFISMLSQREMFEHQIAQEKDEIERYPDEEAEELALIYEARGIPIDEARDMAKHLIADPEKALDALTREELGLNPDELGSPVGAAISSFLTFSVGASVPLVPFLLGHDKDGIVIAAILAGIALFAVGSVLSLFSGKNAIFGGARMVVVGSFAAAATYGIGTLLGASVS